MKNEPECCKEDSVLDKACRVLDLSSKLMEAVSLYANPTIPKLADPGSGAKEPPRSPIDTIKDYLDHSISDLHEALERFNEITHRVGH